MCSVSWVLCVSVFSAFDREWQKLTQRDKNAEERSRFSFLKKHDNLTQLYSLNNERELFKVATKAKRKSIYSVHPGVLMTQKWIGELKEKTGRSFEEWLKHIKKSGPKTEAERRQWLKVEFKLGTNNAGWLAERAEGKGQESSDPDLYLAAAERDVEKMYSGAKGQLRPIYDALLKLGLKVGKEAKACPCQTIVPLYRNHVFAQIKPTTQTRIDLGFALGDTKPTGRLIDTGGFAKKDRITHRIPITSLNDIDDEVKHWLIVAYERDAK